MTRYSPGEWYGVVTPAGVALLPRSVPMAAVERVWMDLRAGQGLAAVIDGLVGAFGTSLARLPDFGVLALAPDGEVRAAIRGGIDARLWLVGMAEPIVITGAGVTTWNERSHSGIGRAELEVTGGAEDELLPVIDGVLRAGRVDVAILEFDTQPQDLPVAPQDSLMVSPDSPVAESTRWSPPVLSLPPTESNPPAELEESADSMRSTDSTGSSESQRQVAADAQLVESADPTTDALSDRPDDSSRSEEPDRSADLEENGVRNQPGPDGGVGTDVESAQPLVGLTVEPDPPPMAPRPQSIAQTTIVELEDRSRASVPGSDSVDLEEAPVDYDKLLFGETMMSSAEEAAVRVTDEDEAAADADEARPRTESDTPPIAGPVLASDGPGQSPAPLPPPGFAPQLPPPPPPLPTGLIAGLPRFGAPPPPPPPSGSQGAPASRWTDHDGETVMVENLQAALAAGTAGSSAGRQPVCAQLLIPGRSPLPLDRSTLVGTRPRLTRAHGDKLPQLVAVESPNGEISRNHVELRVEGVHVLAIDLNSTNGTVLLRAGSDPVRLQPGEPSMLVSSDRLDLGDGLVLSFEGLG